MGKIYDITLQFSKINLEKKIPVIFNLSKGSVFYARKMLFSKFECRALCKSSQIWSSIFNILCVRIFIAQNLPAPYSEPNDRRLMAVEVSMYIMGEKSLNSDGQQIHQYQRKRAITSHLNVLNKQKITTYLFILLLKRACYSLGYYFNCCQQMQVSNVNVNYGW